MNTIQNGQLTDLSKMINSFFNESFSSITQDSFKSTSPASNILEHDDRFELELIAPGLEKSDFNINIEKNVLTIATDKAKEEQEGEKQLNLSFDYSRFKRSFDIPNTIAHDKISAEYENGILSIALPKKPEEQTIIKQIKIK